MNERRAREDGVGVGVYEGRFRDNERQLGEVEEVDGKKGDDKTSEKG